MRCKYLTSVLFALPPAVGRAIFGLHFSLYHVGFERGDKKLYIVQYVCNLSRLHAISHAGMHSLRTVEMSVSSSLGRAYWLFYLN